MLKNKSILLPAKKTDGIRVCVMRSVHDDYQFDLWYQALAPSRKLVAAYVIKKKISWKRFKKLYQQEQKNQEPYLESLLRLIKKASLHNLDVTLLCGEKDYHGCHRELIIERLRQLDPSSAHLLPH